MDYTQMAEILSKGSVRCGNCKDRHPTVRDVKDCHDMTLVMEAYAAEQQADYLAELEPVWSNYGGWVA